MYCSSGTKVPKGLEVWIAVCCTAMFCQLLPGSLGRQRNIKTLALLHNFILESQDILAHFFIFVQGVVDVSSDT